MMQVTYGPEFFSPIIDENATFREGILELQDHMLGLPSTLEDCTLRHIFAPGSYAREMTIPKGTLIIGKIQFL